MHAKAALEGFVQVAKETRYDETSKQRVSRREVGTQWYKMAAPRIKKIEEVLSEPTIVFGIHGMWVANEKLQSNGIAQLSELPLSLCRDGTDRLRAFWYRDPRILRMLVERIFVSDIAPSIYRYQGSREEPPSLILTPSEIPFYVHMPVGESGRGLASIRSAAHFPVGGGLRAKEMMPKTSGPLEEDASLELPRAGESEGMVGNKHSRPDDQPQSRKKGAVVAALRRVPTPEEPLAEAEAQRLSLVISRNVRTFEIVFDSRGATDEHSNPKPVSTLLLSSSETNGEDLERVYIPALESIYGKLDYEILRDKRPRFVVEELPRILEAELGVGRSS
jgi:hypothetical protein